MSVEYCVYGLQVQADAPIPGLSPSERKGEQPVDVRVRLNQRPSWWEERFTSSGTIWYKSPYVDARGTPILTIWQLERSGWFRFAYQDGNGFLVNPESGEVWSAWAPGTTAEDSATYLVGPVMGFVLRLRGICCLHASAVNIGGKIVAFTGPPQAGKSTTAAALGKLGYPVVSDDIVALSEKEQHYLVRPGYPRVCLWPDVTATLYGSSDRLPQIIPNDENWNKRYLDLTSGENLFQSQSLPLAAIYLLHERQEDDDCPRVEAVSTNDAVARLAANTYMNYLLDRDLRSREFRFLSHLVSRVPVRRIIPHKDQATLPRFCEVILEDCRTLSE